MPVLNLPAPIIHDAGDQAMVAKELDKKKKLEEIKRRVQRAAESTTHVQDGTSSSLNNAVTNLKNAAIKGAFNAAKTAFSSTSIKPINLVKGTGESPAQKVSNPTSPSTFRASEKTRDRATASQRSKDSIRMSASKEQAKKKRQALDHKRHGNGK